MSRASGPKMTLPVQLVLRALLAEPTQEMYGLQICTQAGLPSGTIHPILARLEGYGWLESHWENTNPSTQGRPRRRYYHLTRAGALRAQHALDTARTPLSGIPALHPHTTGGPA
jgi:PadR family transcriptional regulator, regulatory protein PadR